MLDVMKNIGTPVGLYGFLWHLMNLINGFVQSTELHHPASRFQIPKRRNTHSLHPHHSYFCKMIKELLKFLSLIDWLNIVRLCFQLLDFAKQFVSSCVFFQRSSPD